MNYVDKKYILLMSPYLSRFKDTGNDVFRFRCPYCGDSQKNKYKARGFFIDKDGSAIYKCHNCGITKGLRSFIEDRHPEHLQSFRLERFKKFAVEEKVKKEEVNANEFKSTNVANKLKDNALLALCEKLSDVDDSHVGRAYCLSRKLPHDKINTLYYISDINIITQTLERYKDKKYKKADAIVIPFKDESGFLTHVQFRILVGEFRYLTLELKLDSKKIYGLDTVDPTKTVYVFEGPFDSMFVNGIAIASGSLANHIKYLRSKFPDFVLVYDVDYNTNTYVMFSLQKAIEMGVNVVLYDKKITTSKCKDINDIVKNRLVVNLNLYLKKRTFKGIPAKLELSQVCSKKTTTNKSFKTDWLS